MVIGFGRRPLLPRLCLHPQPIVVRFMILLRNFYIFLCTITQLFMCINTKIIHRGETQKWDGEEEDGQTPGLEEDHSAIYHHGKDLAGSTAEAHAGTYTDPTQQCHQQNLKTRQPC